MRTLRWLVALPLALALGCPTETTPVDDDDDDSFTQDDLEGPVITHSPPAAATQEGEDITLVAQAEDPADVARLGISYRVVGEENFTTVPMTLQGEDWVGIIPGSDTSPFGLEYFLQAADGLGNSSAAPEDAPTGLLDLTITPNLPPFVGGVRATYQMGEDASLVTWLHDIEDDFDRFEIYRADTPDVDDSDTLVATVTDPSDLSFLDDDPAILSTYHWYRVYAWDIWGGFSRSDPGGTFNLHLPQDDVPGDWLAPSWVHVDGDGRLMVTNSGANEVVRVQPDGSEWEALVSGLTDPGSALIALNRQLLVGDAGASRIAAYEESTGSYSFLEDFSGPYDGLSLSGPNSCIIAGSGRYFVADTGNSRVVRLTGSLTWFSTWTEAEPGSPLDQPWSVVDDAANSRLWLSDAGLNGVYAMASNGDWISTLDADFASPRQLHLDSQDNLLVADFGNDRVLKFDPEGNLIQVIGVGELSGPAGIYSDGDGTLYVASQSDDRVVVFGP